MPMKRFCVVILLMVGVPQWASAAQQFGPVAVELSLDAQVVEVAQPFTLTVTLTTEPGVDLILPELGDTWGSLDVIAVDEVADLPWEGKRRWQRLVKLESLGSGQLQVPAFTGTYIDRRGAGDPVRGQIATKPMAVEVTSVLEGDVDPTQFRDIKGVVELPQVKAMHWFWPVVGATLAVSLLAIGVLAYRTRRSAGLRPDQRALGAIETLLQTDCDAHAFYIQLTAIVRRYLEEQYAIVAPRLTTPEFLDCAKDSSQLDDEDKRSLHALLVAADQVKFARYQPSGARREEAVRIAREFVERAAKARSIKGDQA